MSSSSKIPVDRFTPHGYLATRHTVRKNRFGVIRSAEPLGFAVWGPNHPGPYGRKFSYCAEMNFALAIGGKTYIRPGDFDDLYAETHTCERFTYVAQAGDVELKAAYFLVKKGLIQANVKLTNKAKAARKVRLFGLCDHLRDYQFTSFWQEGIIARRRSGNEVEIKAHPEGESAVLEVAGKCDAVGCFNSIAAARAAIAKGRSIAGHSETVVRYNRKGNRLGGALEISVDLPAGKSRSLKFSLAVSLVDTELADLLATPAAEADKVLAAKKVDDEAFFAETASISGDWPDHWRRGMVYDNQTLRMCIFPPMGVFKHEWDGMQIQGPRYVLAETTFDMFLHGYGPTKHAQQVVLGPMQDAPAPWLPCIREDGSANMIAWDGHPCGTAPEWGAPAWVIERLYRRNCDKKWLADVLKPLTAYLKWWDANRTDGEGYTHYLCSYCSGQDMTPRLDPQRGGGDDTTHCRPVDLHAAMADAWRFVADASELLGDKAAAKYASRQASHYRAKLDTLWTGKWYNDYSTKKGGFTKIIDVMQLAPFYYNQSTSQQAEAARPAVAEMCKGTPHVWPTFMLMLAESAYQVGCSRELAETAAERVQHIYSALDANRIRKNMPLPGVQHEYWPTGKVWGAEGYGWGALGITLIIRYMAGWREDGPLAGNTFTLAPAMPKKLMKPGRTYELNYLPALSSRFDLSYTVARGSAMKVKIRCLDGRKRMTLSSGDGKVLAAGTGVLEAEINNHERYALALK